MNYKIKNFNPASLFFQRQSSLLQRVFVAPLRGGEPSQKPFSEVKISYFVIQSINNIFIKKSRGQLLLAIVAAGNRWNGVAINQRRSNQQGSVLWVSDVPTLD